MQKERMAAVRPKNSANWGPEYNNANLMAFGDLVARTEPVETYEAPKPKNQDRTKIREDNDEALIKSQT